MFSVGRYAGLSHGANFGMVVGACSLKTNVESGTVVVHDPVITSDVLPSGATSSAFTDCAEPWLKP